MRPQLQRVQTSGKDNNCFVHAIATVLLGLYWSGNAHEQRFIKRQLEKKDSGLNSLQQLYNKVNKATNQEAMFGGTSIPQDPQAHIERLGKVLRQFGCKLMMNDVKKSPGERQYSEGLEQSLLAAFDDYCSNLVDRSRDDTFVGMDFIYEKFNLLLKNKELSQDQRKAQLAAWWNKAYASPKSDEKQKEEQDKQLGGYQLYTLELAKNGVQLSLLMGHLITSKLQFNLSYFKPRYARFIDAANRRQVGPTVALYYRGNHWEACLNPNLVKNFNKAVKEQSKKSSTDEKAKDNQPKSCLALKGRTMYDPNYLRFLSSLQRITFANVITQQSSKVASNATDRPTEYQLFGQAFATCYKVHQDDVAKFISKYSEIATQGISMVRAVGSALAACRNHSGIFFRQDADKQPVDENTFATGFVAGCCSQHVAPEQQIAFARQFARALAAHGDMKEALDAAEKQYQETNKAWAEKTNRSLSTMFKGYQPLQSSFQHANLLNTVEVAAGNISYAVKFNDGTDFNIHRAAADKPNRPEIVAQSTAAANLTVGDCFSRIAQLFMAERCHKLSKASIKELPPNQRVITLDRITPPSYVQACIAAFKRVGFTEVNYTNPRQAELAGKNMAVTAA